MKKILLVTGKNSFKRSAFYNEINTLKNFYLIDVWNYQKTYPDYIEIQAFLKQKFNYDLIISFGGGTVIDVAKILTISKSFPIFSKILADQIYIKEKIYHLCVPTTFGSGSESTSFAVLYKNKRKYSISHKIILPDDVILNHNYTIGLNGKVSYCSIMDSFCQSIESLWSVNKTNQSIDFAFKAISLIKDPLKRITELSDSDREKLLLASHYSGKAINISKTTGPHAFSYYLTLYHNICHGEAVSILFEEFIGKNFESIKEKDQLKLFKLLNIKSKEDFILYFKVLKDKINFKRGLQQIPDLDLEKYSKSINLERLKNNPVEILPKKFIYDSLH